jgi:CMP-N-acetylneuraminic acid synthetase
MARGDPGKPSLATSSLYVIIPLRKGSKGCPGKSLRPFKNSTLLEHAVHDALMLDPAHVIVTTDYAMNDIPLSVWRYYTARPAHLCHDDTPMSLVLKHVARDMYPMDTLLLMQPNCYHPERVRLATRVLAERAAGTSVRYPDFWHPAYAIGGKMPKSRQGLEPAYRPDGLLYRVPVAHLLMVHPFAGNYIPVAGTANVDTEEDWFELREAYEGVFFDGEWKV